MDTDENCKNYLRHLLDKAITSTNFLVEKRISNFFRNKNAAYWWGVDNNGKVMMPLLKDMGGDRRSPINGKLKGVFLDVTLRSGSLPDKSPFGQIRVVFPIEGLYDDTSNLYFTDFYCKGSNRNGNRNHFVTLVLSKKNSIADDFCKKKLLQLNPETNRFFRRKSGSGKVPSYTTIANPPMHVEVFYTESVNQRELEERFGTQKVYRCLTGIIGKGSSTWGGVPKDTCCPVCNPYETSSIKQPLDIEVVPDEVDAIPPFRSYNSSSSLNTDSTISRRRRDLTVSSARQFFAPTGRTSVSMGNSSGIVDSEHDITRKFRDVYISPAIQANEMQTDREQNTNSVARDYASNDITGGLQGSFISSGSRVSDMLASRRNVSHEREASSPYAHIEYVSPFTSRKYSSAYTGSVIGSPSADKGNFPHYTGRLNLSSYPKREIIFSNNDKNPISHYTDREKVSTYNYRGNLSATKDKEYVSPITDRESLLSNSARGIISPHHEQMMVSPDIDRDHGSPFTDRGNVFPNSKTGNISTYPKREFVSPYTHSDHVTPHNNGVNLSAMTGRGYVSPITGRESRLSSTARGINSPYQEQKMFYPDIDRDHGSPNTDRGNVFPYTERGKISTYPKREFVSPYTHSSHVTPHNSRVKLSATTDKGNVSPITDRESRFPNTDRGIFFPYQEKKNVSPDIDRDHGSPNTDRGNVFPYTERGNISTYRQTDVVSPYTNSRHVSPYIASGKCSTITDRENAFPYADKSLVSPYKCREKLSALTDKGNVSPITDRESRFPIAVKRNISPHQEQTIVSLDIDRDHGSPFTDRGHVFPNSKTDHISTYPQREVVPPNNESGKLSTITDRGSVFPNTDRGMFSSFPKRNVPPYPDRRKLQTTTDIVNFPANFWQLRHSHDLERERNSPST